MGKPKKPRKLPNSAAEEMIGEEGGVLSDKGAHEPHQVHDTEEQSEVETDIFGFRQSRSG